MNRLPDSFVIHYFSNSEDRITVCESSYNIGPDYVMLNPWKISHDEILAVIDWCNTRDCIYHGSGVVEFNDKSLLLEFTLRWS